MDGTPQGGEQDDDQALDQALVVDVFARACPSRSLLADVTGRWGTLAVLALDEGTARFGALRRRVDGVSEKMLAQTLQALERDGLVVREVVTSIPPHVEYTLTPLGRRVAERLRALVEVLEDAVPEVLAARADHEGRVRAAAGDRGRVGA
ncbi:winged helix-turn-helix transcriptional regulator [Quadrisphaera oryzae]|uniref:winged helix-turn-helix transcriptional regulator n=1 Tax=Quadrisphaera TaxID=317661 RepID=UPI001646BAEC|nr:helix-turn-helix transcriptional regulator [Quadrisphaera sp. RL12-1S]